MVAGRARGPGGLIVLIPIWLKPYVPYGYDSLFHLFSLVSLDQRIAAGDVYPLRFPGFAYGYGWAELATTRRFHRTSWSYCICWGPTTSSPTSLA